MVITKGAGIRAEESITRQIERARERLADAEKELEFLSVEKEWEEALEAKQGDIRGCGELMRRWFNWCGENSTQTHPEKIEPIHTALYLFIVNHCKRTGLWWEGEPLKAHIIEELGIKNRRAYEKAFNDLIRLGVIQIDERGVVTFTLYDESYLGIQ